MKKEICLLEKKKKKGGFTKGNDPSEQIVKIRAETEICAKKFFKIAHFSGNSKVSKHLTLRRK